MTINSSIPNTALAPTLPAPIPRFELIGDPDARGPAFADAALAAYPGPVDPAFRRRMDFYALLIPYHEVRFGLDTHQPDHLVRGLAAIRAGASAG